MKMPFDKNSIAIILIFLISIQPTVSFFLPSSFPPISTIAKTNYIKYMKSATPINNNNNNCSPLSPLFSNKKAKHSDSKEEPITTLNTTVTNLQAKLDTLLSTNEKTREYTSNQYTQNSYYTLASRIANFKSDFKRDQDARISNSKCGLLEGILKSYEEVLGVAVGENHDDCLEVGSSSSSSSLEDEGGEVKLIGKTFHPLLLQLTLKLSGLGVVPLVFNTFEELRGGKHVEYDEKTMKLFDDIPLKPPTNEKEPPSSPQQVDEKNSIDDQQQSQPSTQKPQNPNTPSNPQNLPIFVKLMPSPSSLPKTTPFNPCDALSFNKELIKKAWVVKS